jgi:DNA-binding Lrp family transcriptional regulator
MNDLTLIKIWSTLINYPRIPFKQVAKRCKVSEEEVAKAASVMGRHANKKRTF